MNLRLQNFTEKRLALKAFIAGLILSMTFIVPVMIENSGIFMYYGDFNAQEIPFYQLVHDELWRGNFSWTNLTDLGSATISSYMFYLIGSPFFWITMLFPSGAVPYLMGPLFMLKFGCASLTAYIYLKRYVRNPMFAVAGGLLYAFSGFSIYNIFFFHFHEPMIIFPLLLWSIDRFMLERKRGLVALTVFAACIVNYYFFAGMAVFCAVYWLMLIFTNTYELRIKELLLLGFEILTGFAATAFLILPTILFIMGNPRLSSFPDGFDALAYNIPQRYWYIILSFFFPPELAAQPNFTPDVDCNWASVSGWLPLVGMTGVIGYLQLRRRDWIKKLILVLMISALIPALNSMFQMLNFSIYYARWYYMFVLILVLATVRALESSSVDWNRAIRWSVIITVGIAAMIGLMPKTTYDDNENPEVHIGLSEYPERYWIYVAIALFSLFAFVLIIKMFGSRKRLLSRVVIVGICLITVVSSTYIVQTGNSLDAQEKTFLKKYAVNAGDRLKIDDIQNVRSDFYESADNLAMYWQIPSMNTFHSVVSTSIMDFYDSLDITRDVASRPNTDCYGIRALLSCKYLFDQKFDDEYSDSTFTNKDGKTQMPCWSYLKSVNGCKIYENDNYVPMGFMYDSFITEKEFRNVDKRFRSEATLKSLTLSEDDCLKYRDITGYTESDIEKITDEAEDYKSKTKKYRWGKQEYTADCDKLRENSCKEFRFVRNGFEAKIENRGEDNLVFFSVPYEDGWEAEIDGKKAEIVKANIGFMAVRVDGHKTSQIRFEYKMPAFHTGIIISSVCGIIYFMYLGFLRFFARKRRK